jgi:hypothetical protein
VIVRAASDGLAGRTFAPQVPSAAITGTSCRLVGEAADRGVDRRGGDQFRDSPLQQALRRGLLTLRC